MSVIINIVNYVASDHLNRFKLMSALAAKILEYHRFQWRIQDFPEGGAPTLRGAPTYYLPNFSGKLHENEEILAEKWGRAPPLDPPLDLQKESFVQRPFSIFGPFLTGRGGIQSLRKDNK